MNEPIVPTRSRARIDADVNAELNGWIDERAAELIKSGLDADTARAQSVREFGDLAGTQRYCAEQDAAVDHRIRLGLWVGEFFADMRIAARTLLRTPTVTAVVLLTFAIGIGGTTAIFSAVYAVLLRKLPFRDAPSLVHLHSTENGANTPSAQVSAGTIVALRERTTSFDGVAALAFGGYTLTDGGEPEVIAGGRMTANAMSVLGVYPLIGRAFGPGDDSTGAPPTIALSEALWKRRFGGDSSIVGRMIDVSGVQRRVIAVMPRAFHIPTYEDALVFVPLNLDLVLRDPNRIHKFYYLRAFARVRDGVTAAVAQQDVDRALTALATEYPDAYANKGARIVTIRDAVSGTIRPQLLALMGGAVFVLLIACANIAGVLLARALARRHELTVRVALGAGRRRLMRQFFAEGVVLTSAAAAVGLGVAALGIIGLRAIAGNALPPGTELGLEPRVVAFALGVAVICGVLFSLVPALSSASIAAASVRRDGNRTTGSRAARSLRMTLVGGQIAVSVALLVAAGLFSRSLSELANLNLGYRTDQVLSFNVGLAGPAYATNAAEDQFWPALYEQLRTVPGVTAAGGVGVISLMGSASSGLAIEGRAVEDGKLPEVKYLPASDEYFHALDIPLIRGRTFGTTDRSGAPPSVIVSQSLAKRFWGDADPIGAHIRLGPDPSQPWSTIVGVVGDVRLGAEGEPYPTAYTSQRQDHWRSASVVLRATGEPSAIMGAVREAVHRVDPRLPVAQMTTLGDLRARVLSNRRLQARLTMAFALVALVLSAIGLYGASSYAVEARMQEFGIRMALGAPQRAVLMLALRDGARAAAIGVLIGLPLALAVAGSIRGLLYHVTPTDPATFAGVIIVLGFVALGAALIPARRATLADPAKTIRTD